MNLSALSRDTNRLGFATNWWLFLVTALPLTLLTLGTLGIAFLLERRKKIGNERTDDFRYMYTSSISEKYETQT